MFLLNYATKYLLILGNTQKNAPFYYKNNVNPIELLMWSRGKTLEDVKGRMMEIRSKVQAEKRRSEAATAAEVEGATAKQFDDELRCPEPGCKECSINIHS